MCYKLVNPQPLAAHLEPPHPNPPLGQPYVDLDDLPVMCERAFCVVHLGSNTLSSLTSMPVESSCCSSARCFVIEIEAEAKDEAVAGNERNEQSKEGERQRETGRARES